MIFGKEQVLYIESLKKFQNPIEKEENLAGRADIEDEESDDEIYLRLQGEEVKNPLIGKRHNVFF